MDEEDKPHHYKFRITDHVNRLIKNDSANVSSSLTFATVSSIFCFIIMNKKYNITKAPAMGAPTSAIS